MIRVAGDDERSELGLDECRGVERLLVAAAGSRFVTAAAAVAGEPENALREAGLVTEPAKRVEAGLGQIVPAQCDSADDHGVRKTRVVVGEPVLEPEPARRRGDGVGL